MSAARPFLLLSLASCATTIGSLLGAPPPTVHAQALPQRVVAAVAADFEVPAGMVAMHYYGSGGWGIKWGATYVLAAPYFSNHPLVELVASEAAAGIPVVPDLEAVRAGFAQTPVAQTSVVLIGHGHVDHAGDVQAFFEPSLIATRPALIADRSTTNALAALAPHFSCIAPIDSDALEHEPTQACPVPGVRITALHHGHAAHLNLAGLDVAASAGAVQKAQAALPGHSSDFKLGNTWAYLIDLLDERGAIVFRIHYVDAAASPRHGLVPRALLAKRAVDVHIGCVPGFEQSELYPETIVKYHHTRYVFAAHWEDFFQPRSEALVPVRGVLTGGAVERFVERVEASMDPANVLTPVNKTPERCETPRACGPHGPGWTLPAPGETFQFRTGR